MIAKRKPDGRLLRLSRSNFREIRPAYVPNGAAPGGAGSSNLDLLSLVLLVGILVLAVAHGSSLASLADSAGYIAYASDRTARQFEIFRIHADGTDDRRLTVHLFADEVDPDWSPDGSKIAFVSNRFGSSDIFIMNYDGSNPWRLIVNAFRHEVDPAWSPGGMEIAFAWDRQGGQFDIWIADLRTGIARQVTNAGTDERHPSWSPDGRYVAYTCEHSSHSEICVVDLRTLEVQHLTENLPADARQPAWSPDGTQILFTVFQAMTTGAQRQSESSSPARWLSPLATMTATAIASATATVVPTATSSATDTPASTATREPGATPIPVEGSTIWIMNADGSHPRQLIDLPHRTYDPTWSPDGTRIAFARQRINFQDHELEPPIIYIYDIQTGQASPLTSAQGVVRGQAPDWIGGLAGRPTPTPTQVLSPLPPPATAEPTATPEVPPPPPPTAPIPTTTPEVPPPPPPTAPIPTATSEVPPPPPPPPTATSGLPPVPPSPSLSPPPPTVTPTRTKLPPPPTATASAASTWTPQPPTATRVPSPTSTARPATTVTVEPPAEAACQVIQNPGFETGPPATPWSLDRHGGTGSLVRQEARHSGQWGLRMGAENSAWDEARQVISLVCPDVIDISGRTRIVAELSFWTKATAGGPPTGGDVLNVVLLTADGRQLLRLLKTLTDHDADGQWHETVVKFRDYVGETIQIAVGVTIDEQGPATFDVDDVRLVLKTERARYEQYLPTVRRSRGIQ